MINFEDQKTLILECIFKELNEVSYVGVYCLTQCSPSLQGCGNRKRKISFDYFPVVKHIFLILGQSESF